MLPLSCLTDLNEIDLIFCYLCIQSQSFRIPVRAFSIDGYERIHSGLPFREGEAHLSREDPGRADTNQDGSFKKIFAHSIAPIPHPVMSQPVKRARPSQYSFDHDR